MRKQDDSRRAILTKRSIHLLVLLTCNRGRSLQELSVEMGVCKQTVKRMLTAVNGIVPVITINEQEPVRDKRFVGSTPARYRLDRTWMKQFVPEPVLDMWVAYEQRTNLVSQQSNIGKGGC